MSPPAFWKFLGASCVGTSHRTRSTPCQDAWSGATFGENGDWLVVAVADGAGTATHSEIGAAVACQEAINRVRSSSWNDHPVQERMFDVLSEVRDVVLSEAERLSVRPRELACTFLLAVIGPESAGFLQVGDGAIIVRTDGSYRAVIWPEPEEYANATHFLTDDNFRSIAQFVACEEPIQELAMLSDGLQRVALDFALRLPHEGFFRPFFEQIRATHTMDELQQPLLDFLDSPRMCERTDDDKTLVIAKRLP